MISPDFTLPYARRLDEQIRQTYEKIVNSPTDTSLDTLHAYHSSFSQGAGLGFRKVTNFPGKRDMELVKETYR